MVYYNIAEFFIAEGILTEDEVTSAMAEAGKEDIPLSIYLLKNKIVDSSILAEKISQFYKYPYLSLSAVDPAKVAMMSSNLDIFRKNYAVPLFKTSRHFFVGICDPAGFDSSELKMFPHLSTVFVIIDFKEMAKFIDSLEESTTSKIFAMSEIEDAGLDSLNIETEEPEGATRTAEAAVSVDDTPIVRFVHKIILDAVYQKCSDIHFDVFEEFSRVRYRKDGILKEVIKIPKAYTPIVISRIKVISKLDTTERRVPQDGRFKLRLSKKHVIDFRVNTCPNIYGEKIVLRILDPLAVQLDIDLLGLLPPQKKMFLEALEIPNSIILVTGPTGSGKTVTLYSLLKILNSVRVNICTVEDPVEFVLPGLSQTHVDLKSGLDFRVALRAFLRQDPDIMMIGEIRDKETMTAALQASQTGHVVLSTLHTNNACDAVPRLVSLGVERFGLASALTIVVAQRLLRKLCDYCKLPINNEVKEKLAALGVDDASYDLSKVYMENGCKKCMEGYSGRSGIFEILKISPAISRLIVQNPSANDIAEVAKEEGMIFMHDAALEKVLSGITSYTEAERYIRYKRF